VYFDPFLTGNRHTPFPLAVAKRADFVLVSHDHAHHVGDAFALCRQTGARLVGITGLADVPDAHGVKFEAMNIGGKAALDGLTVHMVPALHAGRRLPAAGYIIEMDGFTIYHAGDTGYFPEMKRLGE